MRISTPLMQQRGLDALLENQARLSDVQQQVATGRRILTPASDPIGSARALDLSAFHAGIEQFQRNIDAGTSRLGLEESALVSAVEIVQRVRDLSLQGVNPTLGAEARADIAAEIGERLGQLVQTANARDAGGEYLFAGNATRTQPFVLGTSPGSPVTYAGDQGQRMLAIGPGGTLASGDPGSEVFVRIPTGNGAFSVNAGAANAGTLVAGANALGNPGLWPGGTFTLRFTAPDAYEVLDAGTTVIASGSYGGNDTIAFLGAQIAISGQAAAGDSFTIASGGSRDVFATFQDIADALTTPIADGAARAQFANRMNRAIENLDHALGRLVDVRAKIGARLNAIERQRDSNEATKLEISRTLSKVEDIDLAEAVSRMNQQLGALEASQQSFARIQDLTLFDFLR